MAAVFITGQIKTVADERLSDARTAVSQWVEVESTLSRERLAWEDKKQLLENLVAVAEAEIAMLKDQMEEAKSATDKADARRAELVRERDENAELSDTVKTFLDTFEIKLKTLFPRLPKPLRTKLEPMMARLPNGLHETSGGIASRMQAIVGMVSEIQQFDKAVTTGEELLEWPDGETREIYTIHFGLGVSYYMTSDRKDGGVGKPTEQGWQWESKPELAAQVEKAIALASGNSMEAGFLSLPVATQQTER